MSHQSLQLRRTAVMILFFVNGALFATWASRIPAVQAARGLSNSTLGLALLALAFGALSAMPVCGLLISRIGSRLICQCSALGSFVMLPLVICAPSLLLCFSALFLFGLCQGALDVAMNAQAVSVEKLYRKPIMSTFHALWSTGSLSGAALGSVLAAQELTPLSHALIVSGVLCLATIPFLHFLLRPEHANKPAHDRGKPRRIFSLRHPAVLALGAIAFCGMMGEGAIADWSALYLRDIVGTGESLAAVGFATFSVTMAAGRFLGDTLNARFGPANLVRTGGILATAGLLLALVFGSVPATLLGFAFVGAGFATLVPIVFSASGNIPGLDHGVALGSVTTFGYLGFLVGPPLIGFTADQFGLRGALGIVLLASVLIAALARATQKEER